MRSLLMLPMIKFLFLATVVNSAVVKPGLSLDQSKTAPHTDNGQLNLEAIRSDPTTTTSNSTGVGVPSIACSGQFGYDLKMALCLEALDLVPQGREPKSFGMRYDPVGRQSDVKLPYRWISRE